MIISDAGIRFIKSFEGFRSHPYLDVANIPTIGYGHTKNVTLAMPGIAENIACDLLQQDLHPCEISIQRLIKVELSQGEYDAIASFIFNLGSGSFQRSTLRQKINRNEKQDAAKEFLKWCYAAGRKNKGLLRRRYAEMQLFLS